MSNKVAEFYLLKLDEYYYTGKNPQTGEAEWTVDNWCSLVELFKKEEDAKKEAEKLNGAGVYTKSVTVESNLFFIHTGTGHDRVQCLITAVDFKEIAFSYATEGKSALVHKAEKLYRHTNFNDMHALNIFVVGLKLLEALCRYSLYCIEDFSNKDVAAKYLGIFSCMVDDIEIDERSSEFDGLTSYVDRKMLFDVRTLFNNLCKINPWRTFYTDTIAYHALHKALDCYWESTREYEEEKTLTNRYIVDRAKEIICDYIENETTDDSLFEELRTDPSAEDKDKAKRKQNKAALTLIGRVGALLNEFKSNKVDLDDFKEVEY